MKPSTTEYSTVFGSLDHDDKGAVEAIADDPLPELIQSGQAPTVPVSF